MATVNISSYAGSVSAGDWTPAITAAVDAIDATGGTITIDQDIEMKSQCNITPSGNYYALRLVGDGGVKITVNAGTSHALFNVGNLTRFEITGINFVGETGTSATADCGWIVLANYTPRVIIERCTFSGVVATYSLLRVSNGEGTIVDNHFGGCGAVDGHVHFYDAVGGRVVGCEFYDYNNFLTSYYDRQGSRNQWIYVNTSADTVAWPAPATQAAAQLGAVTIDHCRFDEGAEIGIVVDSYPRIYISDCAHNLNGTAGGIGIKLTDVKRAEIVRYVAGYTTNARPALSVTDCEYVTVDGLLVRNGVTSGTVDALTTAVTVRP